MNAEQITVAAFGKVHVTTYPEGGFGSGSGSGAVLPGDLTDLASPWVELGYVTEEGVTFTAEPTVEDINAWQKATPVRRLATARSLTASFQLLEWDKDTFALAFGGGTWSSSNGVYRYTPPADTAALAEYALAIDAEDGDRKFRLVIKRGNITDTVETNLIRTGAAVLPITFSALTPDEDDSSWYFLGDDDAFDPGSGSGS